MLAPTLVPRIVRPAGGGLLDMASRQAIDGQIEHGQVAGSSLD
jgi:hypothetical protein